MAEHHAAAQAVLIAADRDMLAMDTKRSGSDVDGVATSDDPYCITVRSDCAATGQHGFSAPARREEHHAISIGGHDGHAGLQIFHAGMG